MARTTNRIRLKPVLRGVLSLGFFSALSVHAAEITEPISLSTFYTVDYDSNVFRLADGVNPNTSVGTSDRSDITHVYGLGAALNLRLGRQRLRANVRATRNDFSRFDFLDHSALDGGATLQWRVGNDWSGDLGYTRSKRLASFGDLRVRQRDLITTDRGDFLARYQLGAMIALKAGLSARTSGHSVQSRSDRKENGYEAGFEYTPATRNSIGLRFRHTDGSVERISVPGSLIDSDFEQDDYQGTFDWRLTGKSVVSGFAGYMHRKHDRLSQRDVSGFTAGVDYRWTPTGKSTLSFTASRQILPYDRLDATYALTNLLSGQYQWQATYKTAVQLRVEHRQREFLGDPGFVSATQPPQEDTTNTIALSATYRALRSLDFSAGVSYAKRTSNRLLLDYTSKSAFFSGRFTF